MLKLFNTLSRKIEVFKPLQPKKVGMYTCGPTVYDYLSVGNWRTYFLGDLVVRTLKYFDYKVDYIMNITDVGHLTGDNLGDADTGEDRMEKASKRERKTALDIAKFYTDDFLKGFKKLNLTKPKKFTKATDYIKEQIDFVKKIEKKRYSYRISDGIYFDVKKWEKAGNKYGELSDLDKIKAGVRVKENPEKKDPRDFALWKFSPKNSKREMEWKSPWGVGFPGWHIECSAMSIKYLGEQFDIHLGGEDLKSIHHPNEIVQSEAVTGKKPFVKYWMHGAFLKVDGGRMGKSLGNAYTLQDVVKKGFEPLALRYLYLNIHYRQQMNFTWEALKGAQKALNHLRSLYVKAGPLHTHVNSGDLHTRFKKAISDDFNMPEALAVVWEVAKSDLEAGEKRKLLLDFDKVLGLGLGKVDKVKKVDKGIRELTKKREELRKQEKWEEADKLRKQIEKKGYLLEDTSEGVKTRKVDNF